MAVQASEAVVVCLLECSWEAMSCSSHSLWKRFVLLVRCFLCWSWLSLDTANSSSWPLLSVADAAPQMRHPHLLVACLSHMFVFQLVRHGDVSASPACFLERPQCFLLLCLEIFELDIPSFWPSCVPDARCVSGHQGASLPQPDGVEQPRRAPEMR